MGSLFGEALIDGESRVYFPGQSVDCFHHFEVMCGQILEKEVRLSILCITGLSIKLRDMGFTLTVPEFERPAQQPCALPVPGASPLLLPACCAL